MARYLSFLLPAVVFLAVAGVTRAQPASTVPPRTYELLIDGESFLVEANRAVKLQSKQKPGVSYEIALRVAPTQRMTLNSVRFDYDWLAKVEDDRKPVQRTARIKHELGFTMLITDLGQPLQGTARDEALKILTESVTETFRKLKADHLVVGQPRDRDFVGTSGRGVVIRYRDPQDLGHTCLVYVLNGPKFGVSCIIRYLDDDLDSIKDLLKKTLDSFRPLH